MYIVALHLGFIHFFVSSFSLAFMNLKKEGGELAKGEGGP